MTNLDGMLLPAQTIQFCDNLATPFKNTWQDFGLDASSETTTLAYYLDAARVAIQGASGLGAPAFQSNIQMALNSLVRGGRYDVYWQNAMKGLSPQLDGMVRNNLPSGWKFGTASAGTHAFDLYLTRLNGLNSGAPATPAAAGVLAAVNTSGGALPVFSGGNAPYLYHTLVGDADYLESLPSAAATRVAMTAVGNSYTYTVAGTVPVGVTKLRLYCTQIAGASGTEGFFFDTPVTPGNAYPVITILGPLSLIRADIPAPAWMCCLMGPEFAAQWALSNAVALSSPTRNGASSPPIFSSNGMLNALNVALGPAFLGVIGAPLVGDRYMGVGNQPAGTLFDTVTITGANTATHVAGAPQTANVNGSNIQGFAGATGLQFRVSTALTGGTLTSVTISYSYLAAATGQTIQTGTLTSGACSGTTVGSIAAFTVPAGELVLSAHMTAVACSATGGGGVVGTAVRPY